MPLLIESKKGKKPVTWNMNGDEAFPSMKVQDVTLLQADGKELEIIVKNYKNTPITREPSQVWIGVFAQQIFANLLTVLEASSGGRENAATGPME